MHITKMHGQGNDFIVVRDDGATELDYAGFSVRVCDRHRGIGADGLIAVLPSKSGDFRMRIFNPDGLEPEMCGNGIRCAAKYFLEKIKPDNITPDPENKVFLKVETLAGERKIVAEFKDGAVGDMTVDMGSPILDPKEISVVVDSDHAIGIPLEICGETYEITCVSMGNPHAVIFLEDDPDEIDISVPGAEIENHPVFPNRTNVEFAKVIAPGEIKIRVWERGVGETLACGTGACATLVAAYLNSLTGRSAVVKLKGGDLHINWRESGEVLMTGPAVTVFEGEYFDI